MTKAPRKHAARPVVVAAATLHDYEALDQTHAEVLEQLRRLEALVLRLERGEADEAARADAAAICRFFDGSARAHHEQEERIVFPPLLAAGDAALVQHVLRLQQDHGWLEEDWRELRTQLATLAEGYTGHDPAMLREMAGVFAALYLEHIALEETVVYPASRQRLPQG